MFEQGTIVTSYDQWCFIAVQFYYEICIKISSELKIQLNK